MPETKNRQVYRVELADGRVFEDVVVWIADNARYEQEAARLKLGTPKGEPFTFLLYTAWAALSRSQLIDGMPWDAFRRGVVVVEPSGTQPPADPTRPDRGDGSL